MQYVLILVFMYFTGPNAFQEQVEWENTFRTPQECQQELEVLTDYLSQFQYNWEWQWHCVEMPRRVRVNR